MNPGRDENKEAVGHDYKETKTAILSMSSRPRTSAYTWRDALMAGEESGDCGGNQGNARLRLDKENDGRVSGH